MLIKKRNTPICVAVSTLIATGAFFWIRQKRRRTRLAADAKSGDERQNIASSTLNKAFDILLESDLENATVNEPENNHVKDVRYELEGRRFWSLYGHTLVVYVVMIIVAFGVGCLSAVSHRVYGDKVLEKQAFQDSIIRATTIKQEEAQLQDRVRFQTLSGKLDSLDAHVKDLNNLKKQEQRKTSKKKQ